MVESTASKSVLIAYTSYPRRKIRIKVFIFATLAMLSFPLVHVTLKKKKKELECLTDIIDQTVRVLFQTYI